MKFIHTFVLLVLLALSLNTVNAQQFTALGSDPNTFAVGDSCYGPGSLRYDDGGLPNGGGWNTTVTDGRMVLKFTPPSYPWTFSKFCIALTRLSTGTANWAFDIVVYDTTGAGGAPGALITTIAGQTATGVLVFPAFSWFNFSLASAPPLTSGSYYIGIKYSAVSQTGQFVMFDEAPTLLRSGYAWANAGPWTLAQTYWATYRSWGMRTEGGAPVVPAIYSRCKTGLNLLIPDNNPAYVTDTFNVAGITGGQVVKKVYVVIDTLNHTWVGDLRIRLTKGATTVYLCRSPGAGLNGSSGDNFIGTKFGDSARYSIDSIVTVAGSGQLSPPYTGWFKTNVNAVNTVAVMDSLSRFKEMDPNGTWTLGLTDSAAQDSGALRSWCLIIEYGAPVGISQTGTEVPNKYYINQNYPNPFNPVTNIKFGLPKAGLVKLVVFDVLGREVSTLVNEFKGAGQYVVDFDASKLSSGVYFYKLQSGDFTETKKMLLVK